MTASAAKIKSAHRIVELDGLRGVSVMLVVLSHLSSYSGYVSPPKTALVLFGSWGAAGVQVFFVISGFVITKLLVAEHERTGRISLRGFYTRRFFRILPAYWIYSFSVVILSFLGVLSLARAEIPQVTGFLLANLFLSDIAYPSWFWGHTWSLSVEEQFYVVFPLIFSIIFKSVNRMRIMASFLIILYASALLAGPLSEIVFWMAHKINGHLDWRHYLDLGRFFSYPYITVGVFMAIAWERISALLQRVSGFLYILVVLLVALWPFVSLGGIFGLFFYHLRPLAVGMIVGWVVVHPKYFGFLRWQITQLVGACSYSIYLWQQMFMGDTTRYGPWYPRGLWISLSLLVVCAGTSYFLIERNFIALGRRVTANSSQGHPPPTVQVGSFP